MKRTSDRSRLLALVAVFASLNVVCDSFAGIPQFASGVWYSWIFMIEPITGFVLPPYAAFLSTFVGVMAGHVIYPRGIYEFLFTVGAPIGSMISGLLFRRKYRIVLAYFMVLFAAYFATPVSWQLPLWGMWDTYLAFAALLAASATFLKSKPQLKNGRLLPFLLGFYAFIGLEADVLFRIFLFIPCQTYRLLFSFTVEELRFIWLIGAAITPIQVFISILFTSFVGVPLIKIIKKDKPLAVNLFSKYSVLFKDDTCFNRPEKKIEFS